jgi:aryl-alcohol dehydrogenase-like predicted oxidoreductase
MVELRSRIGLGTAQLGSDEAGPLWFGPQDRASAVATVRAAVDAGIDWIDTAPFYGWGRAEEIVGEAVRGRRDEVTILTKCGTVRRPDGSWDEDGSPAAVRADLEATLVRLGTDRVDVLQLHDPDPSVPVEETVGAIAELVAAGKVGAIGLSNHDTEQLRRGNDVAPISVVQHQWSILHHPPETEAVRQWCAETGAAFLAWSPLATGFLVDGFDVEATVPGDRRRSLPWASGEGARRVVAVQAEAAAAGRTVREHALAWVLETSYPIVGARTPEEARALASSSAATAPITSTAGESTRASASSSSRQRNVT